MSSKRKSRIRCGRNFGHAFVCTVISATGRKYEVAPGWFVLAIRYKRLIQEKPLLARVAKGYDVAPCNETGALRLYDLENEISYSIPSQWARIEREYLMDPSGRSVSLAERQGLLELRNALLRVRALIELIEAKKAAPQRVAF